VSFPRGSRVFAAIDLGASSGRVIAGVYDGSTLRIVEVRRFDSARVEGEHHLRWDVAAIFDETIAGLRELQKQCQRDGAVLAGIGVDSWGVDYGLLSRGRVDLSDVRHHRKAGVTADGYAAFATTPEERYRRTGILDQQINTVQQLAVRVAEGSVPAESTPLFIPDLWIYLLTGTVGTDPTIASTSQLLDITTGDWSEPLLAELGPGLLTMPPLRLAGSYAGATTAAIAERLGLTRPLPVFRVAGHDTASAFAFAVPAAAGESTVGLVSSGTWSLAGLALAHGNSTEAAREAGFTSERGARGVLMVRNLSGMWLIQESLRSWAEADPGVTLAAVLDEATHAPGDEVHVFDPGDARLLEPGDMPPRIAALAVEAGRAEPTTRGAIVRAVLDSLAAAYVDAVDAAAALAGVTVDAIRIVGGGSQNALLCQLTADRSGRPVYAGPMEATAIGNLVVQLWAAGLVQDLAAGYRVVDPAAWSETIYSPRTSEVSR
jgi:rhamnulokinase